MTAAAAISLSRCHSGHDDTMQPAVKRFQGINPDHHGVFNGIGGDNGMGIIYCFAQNRRTERNRQDYLNVEAVFPFSYPTTTDPLTGKTGGRDVRCTANLPAHHERRFRQRILSQGGIDTHDGSRYRTRRG